MARVNIILLRNAKGLSSVYTTNEKISPAVVANNNFYGDNFTSLLLRYFRTVQKTFIETKKKDLFTC